nr:putative retrotransposon protein [Tanacetum cinerariifolium]
MTTSSANNSVFRGFFQKQKLTGPNFIDCFRQFRIVLSIEDKLNYLPPALVAPAGQHVAPEILAVHNAWIKGSKEIAGLMLMTIEPEIQRNLEPLHAHERLRELKTLFAQQAEQELLQTTRDFHSCRQEEGLSVSSYVLKMKGYIDNLERLGHPVTLGLGVQKGNKHKKSQSQMADRGHNYGKGKNKQAYSPKPKIPPSPKMEDPVKDSFCHECGEIGHWKRNCPQYLAELLKKKKNATFGAGGSGIFGLSASRQLKPWALSLSVGNGQREAVEAIGAFYLCLPSGLEIVLNNCYYAPSISRGVISVSRLYEDGFVNRFVDNTIQVSKNNMVYFSTIPRMKRIEKLQHDRLLDSSDLRAFEKCVSCMSGKMARKPYTHQVERAKDLLGLIHTDVDVCGSFKIMSRQGACYFVTFTNDFSRYGYVYLLKHKHEVFETFKVFQKEVENQLGSWDYCPSYSSLHSATQWCVREEKQNPTRYGSIHDESNNSSKVLLDYALETAVRILNMVPTKKFEKTPYEVWHGKAPKLSYLKVWGYEAFVKRDTLTKPDKLEPRSIKCIFVGYPKEMMGFSFYYPPENKVLVAQNAEFLENSLINQEASGSLEDIEIIQEEDMHPSLDTSLNHKENDLEIDEPQSDIIPIRRSTRTRCAPDRMCLYIDAEEHELGDLVADIRAIRILIAIAAYYDYEIWQMDVKTAFLNGYLNEEVYMEQPEGFVNLKYPNRKFGFTQNRDEPCVYLKASGSNITFLILYVDDILIMGNNILMLQSVKTYLGRCFAMKDLGEATYILGIKIYRDRSRRLIGLCQSAYIKKILKRYCMKNSKRGSIPMQEKLKLSKSQGASTPAELKRMQNVPYASAVGSIMYAMRCTRPDVAFAHNVTSRFQQNPRDIHSTTIKNILKYLTDADDLKSQTGYVFILNGGAVDWKSAKQSLFATSSAEAEYIDAFDASKEDVWVRKFISGLGVVPIIEEPISMYCDNTEAIAIANESGITKEQELLQTTRVFHSCKQEERQSVSSYILKMKGYIDNLERLGHPVTLSLGKVNKNKKPQPQMAARGQSHGKGKNKLAYAPKPKIPPPPKRKDPAKDSICHKCGETGHWKRNYPQYLAELLKKKKNTASGAGGSGIYVIELNTVLNRSWIYDTGCGTHICNTTQGLRESRKLKPGALSLYVGNGQREVVEVIGVSYLCLPNGLEIVLNNCHYAPSITRGVTSVSRLENPTKDSICHECGEIGHWKLNCPQYLVELMKKKKNTTSGAGGSGLRASRKLKPGALSLYVSNGQREAVEAIGAFYLCLPSGLEIVLNNCHYAPSIARGVIS